MSNPTYYFKPKWLDNLNTSWASERIDTIATREGAQLLYDSLLANKELVTLPVPQSITNRQMEYTASYCFNDLEQHITSLLQAQQKLAKCSRTESTYCIVLNQRLTLLKRILYAYSAVRYESKDKMVQCASILDSDSSYSLMEISPERTSLSGSEALVEVAVRSGLSLFFALLRQSWQFSQIPGAPKSTLCSDVLRTALDVVKSLPPLSLANDNQLSALGSDTLNRVGEFLAQMADPSSEASSDDRRLSCELLLCICVQRGSLPYLLEWILMALKCSSTESSINKSFFVQTVSSMSRTAFNNVDIGKEEDLTLQKAASLLMQVIVNLASDYTLGWGTPQMTENSFDKCDVFVWGSNASCQLAEEKNEKILFLKPKKGPSFQNVRQVEAGLHCTFTVHINGEVTACGKGTYGRLGLGDSSSHSTLKKIPFECKIKKISSSKGSDGHTLALSENDQVYSWGDGDFGKLGHANTLTQRQPKLVEGPLQHLKVVSISAGFRHSAAVTADGRLYVWGEGDMGRLGLGDDTSRHIPTLVPDLTGVGSVSCGENHTLVLSSDGRTVWSFGSGEGGKLGHGDVSTRYSPTVIEIIQGLYIKKVLAGNQFSVALTSHGSVLVWGYGPCLGNGSCDSISPLPSPVEDLSSLHVVDVAVGQEHCIAVTHDSHVLAWGVNSNGQCGLGHSTSPVLRPRRVTCLDGSPIQQVSAGANHSVAWTSPPLDRQSVVTSIV